MTNFEKYWDYTTHKPRAKQTSDLKNLFLANYTSNLLTCCFSPGKVTRKSTNKLIDDKEIFLDDFWRFGIPSAFRRVLWPFII
jgi:hypothetical protein